MKRLFLIGAAFALLAMFVLMSGCLTSNTTTTTETINYQYFLDGGCNDINVKYVFVDTVTEVNQTAAEGYIYISFASSGVAIAVFTTPFDFAVDDEVTWEYYWSGTEWKGYDTMAGAWDSSGVSKV